MFKNIVVLNIKSIFLKINFFCAKTVKNCKENILNPVKPLFKSKGLFFFQFLVIIKFVFFYDIFILIFGLEKKKLSALSSSN